MEIGSQDLDGADDLLGRNRDVVVLDQVSDIDQLGRERLSEPRSGREQCLVGLAKESGNRNQASGIRHLSKRKEWGGR